MSWLFPSELLVRSLHSEQLAAHGGGTGIRDDGLLDSTLQRPRSLVGYSEPDAAALAASLAYRIARNHPFVDGNNRTAFVAAATFLGLNGHRFEASEAEVVVTMLALAAGDIDEPALPQWFRDNSRALP